MSIHWAAASKYLSYKVMNEQKYHPEDRNQPLYASHKKIYSQNIKGAFRSLKWKISWIWLSIYYLTPWLRWDRGPDAANQALLLDIDGRRVYIFNVELWPQEIYLLVGLLVFATVGLFLATALLGRVWCGFTCPQTVFTDLFMWIGRVIEGDRNKRMRLAKSALSFEKICKKALKHFIWIIISLITSLTFVLYFNDAPTATADILSGRGSIWVNVAVGLLASVAYLFAGWFREQICIYVCPWLRFQGAMFDEETLLVTYEEWRGEPRGKAHVGQDFDGRGHCVDCHKCELVCPTGIDIRNGQQVECIGCALCIDACNSVMDKFGLPRGLITYDSEVNQVLRAKKQPTKNHLLRPRVIAYAVIMLLIGAYTIFYINSRNDLEINIQADRAPLFINLSDGAIRNGYTFKILNMQDAARTFTLGIQGIKGATLHVIGQETDEANTVDLAVGADKVGTFRVFIKARRKNLSARATPIVFRLRDKYSGKVFEHASWLQGPEKGHGK